MVFETTPLAETLSVPLRESPTFRLPPSAHGSGCVAAPPGTTSPVVITEAWAGPAMADRTTKAKANILKTVKRAIWSPPCGWGYCIVAPISREIWIDRVWFPGARFERGSRKNTHIARGLFSAGLWKSGSCRGRGGHPRDTANCNTLSPAASPPAARHQHGHGQQRQRCGFGDHRQRAVAVQT